MKEFNSYFLGDDFLSNQTLLFLKETYWKDYLKIKKRKYFLFLPHKWKFFWQYKNIDKLKIKNNERYLQRKLIETQTRFQNVKGYSLDLEQRICILREEDSTLVIAGAGSGKSLTILGKVCYLIEERGLKETEILCLSFTKASSKALENSIFQSSGYHVPVLTFHKLALSLLQSEELTIATPNLLEWIIEEFYQSMIYSLPILLKMTMQYFKPNSQGTEEEYQGMLHQKQFQLFQKKISQFIHLFKANKENEELLLEYLKKTNSKKEYTFLLNVIIIWHIYKMELTSTGEMDFDDMIQKATTLLKEKELRLPYRYLIIDEYQDSSLLRCRLIQQIIKQTHAKIMAVGDDFQSIYRFSGCDLEIFLNFPNYFPHPDILKITNTYRNSQELIDVAGKFVMKNKRQLKKNLISKKNLEKPFKLIYYEKEKETFLGFLEYLQTCGKKEFLVLGRNRKDIYSLLSPAIFFKDSYYYYKNLKFQYMTIHQSKGLEAEFTVLIHLENSIMGFPNKLEEDPVFRFLHFEKEAIAYEEERRLFYVAITRTKNENYLFIPKNKESLFIKELKRDYSSKIEILCID